MRITRYGFTEDQLALAEAAADFTQRRCAVLRGLLSPDLARQMARQAEGSRVLSIVHLAGGTEFSRDETVESNTSVFHALHLLLNNPRLFAAVRQITRCGAIGCFSGRVYRMVPSAGHHLDWHDDLQEPERLVALSIALSDAADEGGVFRLRRKVTQEPLAEVLHTEAGGAHLFAIAPDIEHCVTPVLRGEARLAFAGWFLSTPDFRNILREQMFGPRPLL